MEGQEHVPRPMVKNIWRNKFTALTGFFCHLPIQDFLLEGQMLRRVTIFIGFADLVPYSFSCDITEFAVIIILLEIYLFWKVR